MIPGRSLSGKTSGRSNAPVASTTALGAHLPQPLARQLGIGRGEMVGQPLLSADEVLRVEAERLRARQQRDARRSGEFGERRGEPDGSVGAVDARLGLGEQRAAELGLIVEQDHARAGARGGERGGEARRSAADHRDVAMGVFERVVIGIGRVGRDAEAGRPADRRLIEARPGALRLHEGLVVEAGRHEIGEQADERKRVPFARRPGVLARRLQPLVELDLRRAQVRRDAALAGVERDDRVGLLGPERKNAARPVVA